MQRVRIDYMRKDDWHPIGIARAATKAQVGLAREPVIQPKKGAQQAATCLGASNVACGIGLFRVGRKPINRAGL